jgi:hypothetical protein
MNIDLHALREFDLRRTAFHEAAHAVVLCKFRGCGHIDITPNPGWGADNAYYEKAWLGRVQVMGPIGSLKMDRATARVLGTVKPPKNAMKSFCLAGLVAEFILTLDLPGKRSEEEVDDLLDDADTYVFNAFEERTVSSTDAAPFGDLPPRLRDVRSCLRVVLKFWSEIEAEALWIVRRESIESALDEATS